MIEKQSLQVTAIYQSIQELKCLEGKLIALKNRERESEIIHNLNEAEFKVFSQWGDDGIIQFLTEYLKLENKVFIEFGVENYQESNTRFLMLNNCWKGLVIDASKENIAAIKSDNLYWQYHLEALCSFITKENINSLLHQFCIKNTPDLLVIDIDGNDYWVWEAMGISPPLLVIEYNSLFGSDRAISVPYQADFIRHKAHYSGLYYGASLAALIHLGERKGYTLVACNNNGNNAYFVRNDKLKQLKPYTADQLFKKASFRESRNEQGKLSYLNYEEASALIKQLPIVNILTGEKENL